MRVDTLIRCATVQVLCSIQAFEAALSERRRAAASPRCLYTQTATPSRRQLSRCHCETHVYSPKLPFDALCVAIVPSSAAVMAADEKAAANARCQSRRGQVSRGEEGGAAKVSLMGFLSAVSAREEVRKRGSVYSIIAAVSHCQAAAAFGELTKWMCLLFSPLFYFALNTCV